jgi:hypothetical protein
VKDIIHKRNARNNPPRRTHLVLKLGHFAAKELLNAFSIEAVFPALIANELLYPFEWLWRAPRDTSHYIERHGRREGFVDPTVLEKDGKMMGMNRRGTGNTTRLNL